MRSLFSDFLQLLYFSPIILFREIIFYSLTFPLAFNGQFKLSLSVPFFINVTDYSHFLIAPLERNLSQNYLYSIIISCIYDFKQPNVAIFLMCAPHKYNYQSNNQITSKNAQSQPTKSVLKIIEVYKIINHDYYCY